MNVEKVQKEINDVRLHPFAVGSVKPYEYAKSRGPRGSFSEKVIKTTI